MSGRLEGGEVRELPVGWGKTGQGGELGVAKGRRRGLTKENKVQGNNTEGVPSQEELGVWQDVLETRSGSGGLNFANWRANPGRAHKRGLPLTIAIAAQRPQEELGLRIGAVCIPHHHLSDGQMVHKGQQPLVGSPVGGRTQWLSPCRSAAPGILNALSLRPHHWGWSASQLQCRAGSTQLRSRPQAQRCIPGCEPPQ